METDRLTIRPFKTDDLNPIHRILNLAFGEHRPDVEAVAGVEERRSWLQWSILSQVWFEQMHQPPYGDRCIVLKSSGEVIGAVGYVPLLCPFDQIPELRTGNPSRGLFNPEMGLFWVINPVHQRRGYATEAARAMIDQAFRVLRLKRILAMTGYDNLASQGVMRKAGMQITANPLPEPPWLQVVGYKDNDE